MEQPQEDWVEASKIWVTNPRNHPEHIEFLRYRDDSTVPDAVLKTTVAAAVLLPEREMV